MNEKLLVLDSTTKKHLKKYLIMNLRITMEQFDWMQFMKESKIFSDGNLKK